jgi:hypothetical protein
MDWLQMAGTGGVAAIVVAIINAVINRRKLGAETDGLSAAATRTITQAAAGVSADLRQDNADLRRRVVELERREADNERELEKWERREREWRRTLHIHERWDILAVDLLRAGTPPQDIAPAPPLYPPPPYDGD